MKNGWQLLAGSLMGIFVLGGWQETVLADDVSVNTVSELQEAVKTAPGNRTIRLGENFPSDLDTTISLTESAYDITIDGNGNTLQSSSKKQLFSYGSGTGNPDASLTLTNMDLEGLGNNVRAISVGGYQGKFILDNVKVNNFQSYDDGGALYTSGNTVLKNSTFSNNKNTGSGYSGGAIASKGFSATLEVTNSRFVGNETMYAGTGNVGGEGGAFYFFQPSASANFIFKNNYFEANKAVETINGGSAKLADGGAIAFFNIVEGTNILFDGNTFRKNIAGDDGGAVLIQTNSNFSSGVMFSNNTFYENQALGQDLSANNGGAIQIYANGGIIEGRKAVIDYVNNTFVNNQAVYDGGAIGSSGYVTNTSAGRYANNLFVGNKARTATKNNIADATIAGAGNLETNIGYDNGTLSNVSVEDVFGSMTVHLVDNYNQITAGTSKDRIIIPTIPIVPEKAADNQVENLRNVSIDQRTFTREAKADIGSVEMDWIKYDSNGGTFTFDEAITDYQGKEYYEMDDQTAYYQVGYGGLERTIPAQTDLKAARDGYRFMGWSTDKTASKPDEVYAPGKAIITQKPETTLYAIWKKAEAVTVHYMTYDENQQLVKISPDETLTGNLDEAYHAHIKQVDGYAFAGVKDGDSISGVFSDEAKEITLIYVKETKEKGAVLSQYQDENGTPLAGDEVSLGEIGSDYSTQPKTIAGYTLKEVQGQETGKYETGIKKVIYIYKKDPLPQGQVTVHYQLEDQTPLTADVVLTGAVDDYYSVEFKTFDGYTLKAVQGTTGGKFTSAAQEVTLIYTPEVKRNGTLLVQYQDENGMPLALDEVTMQEVGTTYTTIGKTIPGYTLKEVIGAETGTYTEGITNVIYVYQKDPLPQGKVTIHYQLGDQTALAPDSEITGTVGEVYFVDIPSFDGYTLKEISGKIGGQFEAADQEVTLVYTKNTQEIVVGFLLVDYQDEEGNTIAPSELTSNNVSTPYDTDVKEIPGYTFKTVIGNPDGVYGIGMTHIVYIYSKNPVKQGQVTVHYQTDQGEQLAEDMILTGAVDDVYYADIKIFETYTLKSIVGKNYGQYTETAQEVTFVYTKEQTGTGLLVVDYLDEQGHPLISSDFFTGDIATDYQTSPKDIPGYRLKETVGAEQGQYADDVSRVTYVYTKEAQSGKIIFHYQDETGKKLQEDIMDEQPVNTPISLADFIKEIDNYTFKEIKGTNQGIYTEETQEITFIYSQKIGKITIKYLDTNGKEIANAENLTGLVGTDYQLEAKAIDGYIFKEVQGADAGKYGVDPIVVTYIYEKKVQPNTNNKNEEKGQNQVAANGVVPSSAGYAYGISGLANNNKGTLKSVFPKTGETQTRGLTIIGLVLLASMLSVRFFLKKKTD
ncbi:MucBP domain-containing protein [Enterococcus wangshanyuanii]|uniref:Gram-positive cocci surface proteins LPxTG domain-containing protein n=1 Tax=Enterococcus wangshanyuanii TaxID=2005703 RepID=A0ABQ1P6I5_9ENTE|nr:MucBP domain-containing protein [Enterococcus wangshanyuanii]GGC91775.1 hypothetical protein GCM10011573_21720 [Enterococcus wangshanyuanii]